LLQRKNIIKRKNNLKSTLNSLETDSTPVLSISALIVQYDIQGLQGDCQSTFWALAIPGIGEKEERAIRTVERKREKKRTQKRNKKKTRREKETIVLHRN